MTGRASTPTSSILPGSDRKVNEEESDRKIRRMLSRSSRLRDILSKPMSDHETEAV